MNKKEVLQPWKYMFQFISKSNLLDAQLCLLSYVNALICRKENSSLAMGMLATSQLSHSLVSTARKSWLLLVSRILFPLPSLLPIINISTADHQTSGVLIVSLLLSCPQR